MKDEDNENNLYVRWLKNELSKEELEQLQKTGDNKILSKIIESVDAWSLPALSHKHKEEIDKRIAEKKTKKIVPFYRQTWFYAAASVVLLLGLFFIFKNEDKPEVKLAHVECQPGMKKTVTLADNTVIVMDGESFIEYDPVNWKNNRYIKMDGNIYFDVHQKGKFRVSYDGGRVNVLGTQFSVQHKNNFTSVKCYEGKVRVEIGSKNTALTTGQGVRSINGEVKNFDFNASDIDPLSTTTTFEDAPLEEVCNALSIHFGVKFEGNRIDFSRNFTGIYKNTSLDTALRMVFDPMGISYTRKGNTVFLENK
ncbi:MAG TPA: FecR domain-containing protein [Flavobacteriales bacterium]|nr:FecR domain-containing protein [Flavobacteriales bacterium]